MIDPPLDTKVPFEPEQLDLFAQSLNQKVMQAQMQMNQANRSMLGSISSASIAPVAVSSLDIPRAPTPEERARQLLHGDMEEGDTSIDAVLQELLALGVEDLRILQINNGWTVECRVCVTNRPTKQYISFGAAEGMAQANTPWNVPSLKTYMRMEVSSAQSLRQAARELQLAVQMYVSAKAVHGSR